MYTEPLFTVFGHGFYLYGLCYALGILACFIFLYFTMKYKKFNEYSSDAVIFIGFFATAFGVFAAMLFESTYEYIESGVFEWGSMTFIGGLIGGVVSFLGVWNLYMYVIRPRTKIKWLKGEMNATLCDALPFIPIGITIAHAIGRLGCFFGGCCYGIEVEWGLPCAANSSRNVMPTQLFEMSFLIILSAVMAFLYFRYKFNYNFALYPIAYGIFRFVIEFYRDDVRGELVKGSPLSPSQIFSIIMVIVGIGFIFAQYYFFSKLMKHPENSVEDTAEATPETEPEENN